MISNSFSEKDEKTGAWKPIARLGSVIPFGYRQDPEDSGILLPIPEELELLQEAKKHLKNYSSRVVAAWLTQQSGRPISHAGLLQRVKVERKRRQKIAAWKLIAKRAEEAAKKARQLETGYLGARISETTGD